MRTIKTLTLAALLIPAIAAAAFPSVHRDHTVLKLEAAIEHVYVALWLLDYTEPMLETPEQIESLENTRLYLDLVNAGLYHSIDVLELGGAVPDDLNYLRGYLSSPHKAPDGSGTASIQQLAMAATVQAAILNGQFQGDPLDYTKLIAFFAGEGWLDIDLAVWHITDAILDEL